MSLLSPNKIKAINTVDRLPIASNLTATLLVDISVEIGKDLHLTLINKGADDSVSIAVSGTKLDKTSGHWLGVYVKSDQSFTLTNNTITLKAGETVLKLPEFDLAAFESVQVRLFAAESSPMYAYKTWVEDDKKKLNQPEYKTILSGYPSSLIFSKKTEKHLKLTIIPNKITATNTLKISALGDGFWISDKFKSDKPIQLMAGTNNILITEPTTLYLNYAYQYTKLTIASSSVGTATGSYLVEEMTEPFVDAPYYEDKNFLVEKKVNVKNFAALENWTAYVDNQNVLTVSDGTYISTIALTSLPSWKANDYITAMGFIPFKKGGEDSNGFSHETSMRLCFFTQYGNTYHNFPAGNAEDKTTNGGMTDFDLSVIYEPVYRVSDNKNLSSARIPSRNASLTAEEQKIYRYEPGLPDWNYQQHTDNVGGRKTDGSAYGSGGLPPVIEKKGIKLIKIVHPFEFGTNPQDSTKPYVIGGYLGNAFSVKSKCTLFAPYNTINATKHVILATTDGGRIWTILHELGTNGSSTKYGNNFNYSSIGSYANGELSLVKRSYVLPSEANKEPENSFSYSSPLSVTDIVTTNNKAIVTTTTAHGLTNGDLICFKKNSNGNYSFLENTVNQANTNGLTTNEVGNGRFYTCKVLTTTTFELLQNYAGVDEKIPTHHIHSSNALKDGFTISCGEAYPNGWILFVPVPQIDNFDYFNNFDYRVNNPYIIRLTSTQKSVQRTVGFILNDDKDQTFLFASDEAHLRRQVTIAGRTKGLPTRSSAGIYKGKLHDIDDLSLAECVYEVEEASLGLVKTQGIFTMLGMSQNTYFSKDGNEWIKLPLVSKFAGEQTGSVYVLSETSVYKVKRK